MKEEKRYKIISDKILEFEVSDDVSLYIIEQIRLTCIIRRKRGFIQESNSNNEISINK